MTLTIEISAILRTQAKQLAYEQNVTLHSIVEEGLLETRQERLQRSAQPIQPVVIGGNGLRPEFRNPSWQATRDATYKDHGA